MRPPGLGSSEVPEGRQNVAHRETLGVREGTNRSPGGVAQALTLCRPSRALNNVDTSPPAFHGGLRFVVPLGLDLAHHEGDYDVARRASTRTAMLLALPEGITN